jgi:hypothetical protein
VYGTWIVQYLASVSIKHLHIIYNYCIFSKSAIFIYIGTQAFAVHTKYYVVHLVILINNKRVGSSNYLTVRSARKASLPYMAQTCPQLPYMAQTCPQKSVYRSRYDVIRFLPLGTIWTGHMVQNPDSWLG